MRFTISLCQSGLVSRKKLEKKYGKDTPDFFIRFRSPGTKVLSWYHVYDTNGKKTMVSTNCQEDSRYSAAEDRGQKPDASWHPALQLLGAFSPEVSTDLLDHLLLDPAVDDGFHYRRLVVCEA